MMGHLPPLDNANFERQLTADYGVVFAIVPVWFKVTFQLEQSRFT